MPQTHHRSLNPATVLSCKCLSPTLLRSLQCVVVSAANARSLSLAAAEKSAVIADVNHTVSRLTAEMGALHSRSSELATQLAEQSSAREVGDVSDQWQ